MALVALAAYVWLELPGRRAEDSADDDARRLFSPFTTAVDQIDIARPEDRVRIELRGTRWEVVEPVCDAAEPARVATLIDAIEKARIERDLGPADEPSRYGLALPVAAVTLLAAGDTLAYLELGAHTLDGAYAFARRRDGDVILVPPAIVSAVTLPASAYRDQNLVRFDLETVDAFAVERARATPVRWNRSAVTGAWFTVVDGDTVAGDSVEVPTYLRRFRGMRVRSFIDPADTANAFANLAGRVTLHVRAPAPAITMRFVARADSTYWCRIDSGTRVVAVQGNVPGALDASPATLRDRRLVQFSPPQARRIEIVTPDTSAVLVRAGDAWALPNPALGRVDARAASDLVRALRALRFRRVAAGSPSDVEPAVLIVRVTTEGDTILEELRGKPRVGSGDWIVTSRSSRVLAEVPASEIHAVINRLRRVRTSGR